MIWIILVLSMIFSGETLSPQDFKWKNRLLIVTHSNSNLDWSEDSNKSELQARKLLVFQFEKGQLKKSNFQGLINAGKFLEKLHDRTGDDNWVLIGLDGGVKAHGKGLPNLKAVLQTIDSMPMRQSEIKKKDDGKS